MKFPHPHHQTLMPSAQTMFLKQVAWEGLVPALLPLPLRGLRQLVVPEGPRAMFHGKTSNHVVDEEYQQLQLLHLNLEQPDWAQLTRTPRVRCGQGVEGGMEVMVPVQALRTRAVVLAHGVQLLSAT